MTFEQFLTALRIVETGWPDNDGIGTLGDGGKSLGPLQIGMSCWKDAMEDTPKDKRFPYSLVKEWGPSTIVARTYFKRYAPNAYKDGDWQVMARIWNGGPIGMTKAATAPYWHKVQNAIRKVEANAVPICPVVNPDPQTQADAMGEGGEKVAGDRVPGGGPSAVFGLSEIPVEEGNGKGANKGEGFEGPALGRDQNGGTEPPGSNSESRGGDRKMGSILTAIAGYPQNFNSKKLFALVVALLAIAVPRLTNDSVSEEVINEIGGKLWAGLEMVYSAGVALLGVYYLVTQGKVDVAKAQKGGQ